MRDNQVHNRDYLKDRRKELRSNLTPAEIALWQYLKGSQLQGRKFRRQHSIEDYIVDFYCREERLIIELDGQVHWDISVMQNDEIRDARLKELKYTVLRFENDEVFQSPESVLERIAAHWNGSTS